MPSGLYKATITFKNVPESWSGKYKLGYRMSNSIGKVSFDSENTIAFVMTEKKPQVSTFIETQSCMEGESVTFAFEAEEMTSAEWTFEKADEEGVMVAYTLDDVKALFPDTSFEASLADGKATLTVNNVKSELCNYTLYANAVGTSASASAGAAQFNVISVLEFGIVACDENYQKFTINCPEGGEYTLYIAGYDESGVLKAVHVQKSNFVKGKADYDIENEVSDCAEVRVMFWGDNMKPLCGVYK